MTDHDTVADWIRRYIRAWDSNDPAEIRALFTPDAEYRFAPADPPVVGHDRITAAWLEGRDEPDDHAFSWEPLAIDGDLAVVQGRTEYLAGGSSGRTYDNLWTIRMTPDGRASAFTEWWIKRSEQ